jgi:hypothetical protein
MVGATPAFEAFQYNEAVQWFSPIAAHPLTNAPFFGLHVRKPTIRRTDGVDRNIRLETLRPSPYPGLCAATSMRVSL